MQCTILAELSESEGSFLEIDSIPDLKGDKPGATASTPAVRPSSGAGRLKTFFDLMDENEKVPILERSRCGGFFFINVTCKN